MTFEVELIGHKQFRRTLPAERLARPGIELPSDLIELLLRDGLQIGALGQILSEQAVGVFVDPTLPWTVRIGEIHGDAGVLAQLLLAGRFLVLIASQTQALLSIDAIQHRGKAVTAPGALAFSIAASVTNNDVRSTSVPTAEALRAPLIRSPSQCKSGQTKALFLPVRALANLTPVLIHHGSHSSCRIRYARSARLNNDNS